MNPYTLHRANTNVLTVETIEVKSKALSSTERRNPTLLVPLYTRNQQARREGQAQPFPQRCCPHSESIAGGNATLPIVVEATGLREVQLFN